MLTPPCSLLIVFKSVRYTCFPTPNPGAGVRFPSLLPFFAEWPRIKTDPERLESLAVSVFVEMPNDHKPGIQVPLARCLIFSSGSGGCLGDLNEHC
jgi:hypothetical protein